MATGAVRTFGVGALVARAALGWVRQDPRASELHRTNFHGRTVTLAGGPALAAGATVAAALGAPGRAAAAAAVTVGAAAGAVGFYDDVVGARPEQKAAKGFAGHLAALREGRVTSGLVKIVGVGAAGLAAAALLAADPRVRAHPGRRSAGAGRKVTDVLLGAGVVAGTANLVNLLDLRPGRAIKASLLIGAPLAVGRGAGLVTGPLGAGAALLPADLGEEIMLGDAGANALGGLLGVALIARTGPVGRAVALTVLAGLTAASEKVSFTKVIQDTPVLRDLDMLGRRPSTP
jgi:UDP-N-acetylmuramyl pentapeptide phosphotransferase/UDP-N-acetylglucosamine-1-phosphate transferase